jgi:hypothetical protein
MNYDFARKVIETNLVMIILRRPSIQGSRSGITMASIYERYLTQVGAQ